ncbi:MAG: SAM-dependent methyltransferase [Lachnospiraceae bacterium]|nr:SAM-dependent methyltransferase [Lachnospiraceae bacterium]
MRELSKRLSAIADFVPEGCIPADVGCDHGYLPIHLILNGVVKEALAMDVREGPLKRAEAHIRSYGLEGRIQTRLSDGLRELKEGEADTIILAGMGGGLMARILSGRAHVKDDVHTYILSPHSEWERLRRYLREEGLAIVKEEMVEEDGKFYPVLQVKDSGGAYPESGTWPPGRWEDRYGPLLLESGHPVLRCYLEKRREKLREIRERLAGASGEKALQRLAELEEELREIETIRVRWQKSKRNSEKKGDQG